MHMKNFILWLNNRLKILVKKKLKLMLNYLFFLVKLKLIRLN